MNRNVAITGANRGIGLALAKHYKNNGDNVYAVCRKPSEELVGLGVTVIEDIDVGDPEAAKALAASLSEIPVDILINNAGIWDGAVLGTIDYDRMKQLFNVNAIGPLRITESLLGNLRRGSKVALITSRMGSIDDNSSGGGYDYRMSKAALNAAGKSLALDLKKEGISVAILHPGFVQTDMVGGHGDITADVAGQRLAERIEELNINNSGTFWHSNGNILPW